MAINKELLILRHGKSDWHAGTDDFNRPLNNRGKDSAHKIGEWLAKEKLQPNLIISSPAIRALTTAEIVNAAMGKPVQSITTEKLIYEATVRQLLQVLLEIPDSTQRVLLVGHNPGLELLLRYFVPNILMPDDRKLMPTACLAYLQLGPHWSVCQGRYFIQRVKDLVE